VFNLDTSIWVVYERHFWVSERGLFDWKRRYVMYDAPVAVAIWVNALIMVNMVKKIEVILYFEFQFFWLYLKFNKNK
jgi:hypothetical protein